MSTKRLMLLSVILCCATWVVAQAAPAGGAAPGGAGTGAQASPSAHPPETPGHRQPAARLSLRRAAQPRRRLGPRRLRRNPDRIRPIPMAAPRNRLRPIRITRTRERCPAIIRMAGPCHRRLRTRAQRRTDRRTRGLRTPAQILVHRIRDQIRELRILVERLRLAAPIAKRLANFAARAIGGPESRARFFPLAVILLLVFFPAGSSTIGPLLTADG